jgi:ferredoxin
MTKIIFEREKCIGCGACAAVCPVHFKIADDGKSELIDSKSDSKDGNLEKEIEKPECAKDAADGCPVQCIHIK